MVRLEQMADDVTPVWMTKLLEVLFKNDLDELTSNGFSKKYATEFSFLMKLLEVVNSFDELMEKALKLGVVDTRSPLYMDWLNSWNV